jgi:hypothetical protein
MKSLKPMWVKNDVVQSSLEAEKEESEDWEDEFEEDDESSESEGSSESESSEESEEEERPTSRQSLPPLDKVNGAIRTLMD